MNDAGSGPDLLDELANDFAQRCRRGERPALSEYTARYPALAAAIRDLFPALAVIEEFGSVAPGGGGPRVWGPTSDGAAPRQLGEYRILREVARGGMGIVYEAVQESLGRHVALKVLPFQSVDDACQLERFRREARAAAMLHHTNIVPVFGVGEHQGVHYFAMQFIRGEALDSVLRALRARRRHGASNGDELGGPKGVGESKFDPHLHATLAEALVTGQFAAAPEAGCAPVRSTDSTSKAFGDQSDGHSRSDLPYFQSVARVGLQIVDALAYAHGQGVLHRDVKPANILLDTEGTAWVTDFGLAKADGSSELTDPGALVGTLRYMAPERFRGQSDPRSDVFSLGLTLYEMATLRPAFAAPERAQLIARMLHDEPPRPRAIDRRIPRDLETVILKAIAKEPARRYQTAAELAEDLRRFLADRPIRAKQSQWPEQLVRWCRRNPALALATTSAAALLLLTVAALATSNVLIQRAQERTRAEKDRAEKARELAENRADEIRRGLEALKAANALLERGRLYANERYWDDAYRHFTKAIRLRPEHVSAWEQRSELFTRLGLWDRAAEDYVRAFDLREPDESFPWFCFALLRLHEGDITGYDRICRTMREHLKSIHARTFNIHMTRMCALSPVPRAQCAALLDEAQALARERHRPSWCLYVLGAVHYRTGQPDRAIPVLNEFLAAEGHGGFSPIAYPLLAMAHHDLGQTAEARHSLEKAADAIEHWTEDIYRQGSAAWAPHLGATGYWPINWWDWLECQLSYREARVLLGDGPPGDEPRLRVARARAFARLGQCDTADAEYVKALALRPDDHQFLLEKFRNRGYRAVYARRWGEAAAEFVKASNLAPGDVRLQSFLAIAHLGAGDVEAYRRACSAMVERCDGTATPESANDIVGACVIVADALPEMARLLPLAHVAADRHVGNARMLGAAQYRAGNCEQAIHNLEKAARVYPLRADDWSFLAMAHHRLGHAEKARHCLANAENWVEAADRSASDLSRPAWGGWEERVAYPLLLLEARQRIDAKHRSLAAVPSVPRPVARP